jgi:hypothetical protein
MIVLVNKLKQKYQDFAYKYTLRCHSNIVKEKAKNYMEKIKETNPEKLKEWRHNTYLNRKAKLKAQQDNK